MSTVEIDVGNEDLFTPYQPPILANGKHLFEVANDLCLEPSKSAGSSNLVIKVELRCQDEGEDKGKPVYDHFVIISDATSEKSQKAKRINEGRLAQFSVACGVQTQEQIKAGEPIPLDQFAGRRCEAITKMESSTDPATQRVQQSSKISRYLFEGNGGEEEKAA